MTARLLTLAAFAGCIVAANAATASLGVVAWFGVAATAGTWLAGLSFVARDWMHETGGPKWVALALIAAAVNALPDLLAAADERDALAAKVEALADWHETKADKARRFPGPESRGLVMEKAAQVHSDAAWRIHIRRALDEEPQP